MKLSVVILASVLLEGEAGLTLVSAFVCDYQEVYNHDLFLTNFVHCTEEGKNEENYEKSIDSV